MMAFNKNYKTNQPQTPPPNVSFQKDSTLEYKEHGEFFERFYKLREKYYELQAEALFDKTLARESFQALIQVINWAASQIKVKMPYEVLSKRRKEIIKLFGDNKIMEALEKMDKLMYDISEIHEEVEILPKINATVESEEDKFWKEERHAGLKNIKKGFMDVLSIRNG